MLLCLDVTCWASNFSMTTSFWTFYIQKRNGNQQLKKKVTISFDTDKFQQASTSFRCLEVSPYCSDIYIKYWHLLTKWHEPIIWWYHLWHAAYFNLSDNRTISECVKQSTDMLILYHSNFRSHQQSQISSICNLHAYGTPQGMLF
jgi:hypothetical protein